MQRDFAFFASVKKEDDLTGHGVSQLSLQERLDLYDLEKKLKRLYDLVEAELNKHSFAFVIYQALEIINRLIGYPKVK